MATSKRSSGKSGSGIHIKKSHEGRLHEALGVPQGQPIPAAKLAAAKNSNDPAVRKMANFAANAKGFDHPGGGKKAAAKKAPAPAKKAAAAKKKG